MQMHGTGKQVKHIKNVKHVAHAKHVGYVKQMGYVKRTEYVKTQYKPSIRDLMSIVMATL